MDSSTQDVEGKAVHAVQSSQGPEQRQAARSDKENDRRVQGWLEDGPHGLLGDSCGRTPKDENALERNHGVFEQLEVKW